MGQMKRAEAAEEETRIRDRFASTLVIAAAIIAAVRLVREPDVSRPSPRPKPNIAVTNRKVVQLFKSAMSHQDDQTFVWLACASLRLGTMREPSLAGVCKAFSPKAFSLLYWRLPLFPLCYCRRELRFEARLIGRNCLTSPLCPPSY